MSRILGLISKGPSAPLNDWLECAATPLNFEKTGRRATLSAGNAVFYSQTTTESETLQVYRGESLLVAIDGHFYNHAELSTGRRWQNQAELFSQLYRSHGFEKSICLLNGDFSVALFDENGKDLWLARDRFGVRPLYYCNADGFFAFASRIRCLLGLPDMSSEFRREFVALFAASHYRTFEHFPEKTPYKKIQQLPAAHFAHVTPNDIKTAPYWFLKEAPEFSSPEEELAERYRDLFLDAVSLRLNAASRPAFTLSGGLDSSSVLASAVQLTGRKQSAFSSVYSDKTYDETDEISSILGPATENWHTVTVDRPDVMETVKQMIRAHDEPVATATWLSHYLLCQKARDLGFGGFFGGLGGDELNAGEYEYYFFYFADLRRQGKEEQLKREVILWKQYHDHPIFRKDFDVMEAGLKEMVDLKVPGRCVPYQKRLKRYFGALNPEFYDLSKFSPSLEMPFQSYLKNRTYHDLTKETAPCCLRAEDRQSSAFGLDHFLPFFDYRLVEFMFQVPGHFKIRDGVTKYLLRKAMTGILPEATRTRIKKTGWNAPADQWFSTHSREPLLDLIHSRAFRERGIYKVDEVERLVNEHMEIMTTGRKQENHMMFLWQLVNLELWLEECIDPATAGISR